MLETCVKMVETTVSDFLPRCNFQKVKNKTLLWIYGDIFGTLQKTGTKKGETCTGIKTKERSSRRGRGAFR